ncbi:hypothetical protein C8R45DRAFT_928895 [Mycena sanguinolenta]|nr:hypothetical protein C8R45DRAFT_928895 [Mycena sanguinolenta]
MRCRYGGAGAQRYRRRPREASAPNSRTRGSARWPQAASGQQAAGKGTCSQPCTLRISSRRRTSCRRRAHCTRPRTAAVGGTTPLEGEQRRVFISEIEVEEPREERERIRALEDDGAMVNAMCTGLYSVVRHQIGELRQPGRTLRMANGALVPSIGYWEGYIHFGGATVQAGFEIFPSGCSWSFLFGKPLLESFGAVHDYATDTMTVRGEAGPTLGCRRDELKNECCVASRHGAFGVQSSRKPEKPKNLEQNCRRNLGIMSDKHSSQYHQLAYLSPDFVMTMDDTERCSIQAKIGRLCPHEAAEAIYNIRPYADFPGKVYVHLKIDNATLAGIATLPADEDVDFVSLKLGRAVDIERRRTQYARECKGQEIVWAFYYETQHCKLLAAHFNAEALIHRSLKALNAMRAPTPCAGCAVKHREYAAEMAAGSLEGVAAIVEYWMERLGGDSRSLPFV